MQFPLRISLLATALAVSFSPLRAQTVSDGSFESFQEPNANYFYNATGFPWTFASTSGIIKAPSAFNGPTTGFDGTQYAFLQSNTADARSAGTDGIISQSVSFVTGGTFKFSDLTARRNPTGGAQASYVVQLDGVTISPTLQTFANSFVETDFLFQATAGIHTVSLVATGPSDSTNFIDQVSISAYTGGFMTRPFAGDADSGISSAKTYTHAFNIGNTAVAINDVNFAAGGTGDQGSYVLSGAGTLLTGFTNNLTGNINTLVKDFYYGGNPMTLTLNGLTPGQAYTTTFFGAGYGNPGGRLTTVMDGEGNSLFFDENGAGGGYGTLLQDTFIASKTTETFSFSPSAPGDTYHFYGFTNEILVAAPEPGSVALVLAGAAALSCRRRRARA